MDKKELKEKIEQILNNKSVLGTVGWVLEETDFEDVAEEIVNLLPILDVSYCAEQTKNVLTNKFCNIAKEHAGETFDKVPEATDILKAIDVIEKHCS